MKYRCPPQYAAPLRSRKEQTEWLLAHDTHFDDGERKYFLSWDVKLWGLDLSFDHLLDIYKSGNDKLVVTPEWLEKAKERFAEVADCLEESAIESARALVMDSDGYQELWDGTTFGEGVEYALVGRSGGHLVLVKQNGIEMSRENLEELLGYMSRQQVRNFYRFIVQCDHDFDRKQVVAEVEYHAAWIVFGNLG